MFLRKLKSMTKGDINISQEALWLKEAKEAINNYEYENGISLAQKILLLNGSNYTARRLMARGYAQIFINKITGKTEDVRMIDALLGGKAVKSKKNDKVKNVVPAEKYFDTDTFAKAVYNAEQVLDEANKNGLEKKWALAILVELYDQAYKFTKDLNYLDKLIRHQELLTELDLILEQVSLP